MGNETSTAEDTDTSSLHQQSPNERKEIAFDETASAFSGFRVLGIQEQSPACNVGFVSFFDFILSANGIRLDTKDSTFMELIAQSEEKPLQLDVYNIKSQTIRQLEITPSRQWSGKGLLGVTIRFDSYEHADDQLLHVLHVVKRSPAFKAGLRAKSDYLLGTPDSVFRDTEDLQTEILQSLEVALPFQCYVYNTEEDQVRIVSILPTEQWGGNGLLGAEVAHGVLHRLPSACRKTIGVSVGFVSLATEITAATDAYMLEQVPAHTPVIQDTSVPSGEAPIMSPSDPLALQPICEEETQEPGNDTYQPEEFSTHASIPSAPVQSSIPANSSDESSNKPRYAPQLDPMFPMSTVEVLADTIIK